jgi:hypothetical protein
MNLSRCYVLATTGDRGMSNTEHPLHEKMREELAASQAYDRMIEARNRPLWEVMRHAGQHARINWERVDASKYAAGLRAIAEEASRRYEGNDPAISLIAWLELEADRSI